MNKYNKYKDSDIEWIGEIPEHWDIIRMDGFANYIKTNITPAEFENEEVFHYSIPNIQEFGEAVLEKGDTIKSNKLLLSGNEVLISKLNPRKKTIVVSKKINDSKLIASSEFIPLKAHNCSSTNFLYYLFLTENVTDYLNSSVESATKSHQRTSPSNIYRMWFACPKPIEQTAIANFLDRKTAEIDELIAKKEKLLKLYEEEKTAIINQAVTKGIIRKDIARNVSYKDSGVDWLGEIPEHWQVKKLKYVVSINKANLSDKTDSDLIIEYIDIENVEYGRIKEKPKKMSLKSAPSRARRIVCNGDTLISTVRTYLKAILFIEQANNNLIATTGFAVISPKLQFLPEYLFYVLSSEIILQNITANSVGISYPAINSTEIGDFHSWFPKKQEQERIICFIKTETARIDKKISKTKKLIELLQEYKTTLISEVVTGKIKV